MKRLAQGYMRHDYTDVWNVWACRWLMSTKHLLMTRSNGNWHFVGDALSERLLTTGLHSPSYFRVSSLFLDSVYTYKVSDTWEMNKELKFDLKQICNWTTGHWTPRVSSVDELFVIHMGPKLVVVSDFHHYPRCAQVGRWLRSIWMVSMKPQVVP